MVAFEGKVFIFIYFWGEGGGGIDLISQYSRCIPSLFRVASAEHGTFHKGQILSDVVQLLLSDVAIPKPLEDDNSPLDKLWGRSAFHAVKNFVEHGFSYLCRDKRAPETSEAIPMFSEGY